jgi:hypothetical protein
MPVTAKLSRGFYERFGDELTNELVEWFNSVDATYRSDLREFNETNFARFEAKLDQRISASEAGLNQRISASEAALNHRISACERRIDALGTKMNARFDSLDARLERRFAEFSEKLTTQVVQSETRMIRWMVGTIIAAAALVGAAQRF